MNPHQYPQLPSDLPQNPYNPYNPSSNDRKYPSVPTPPYQNYLSQHSYPQLEPIPQQQQRRYPSFPVPPTGPSHVNYAPQYNHIHPERNPLIPAAQNINASEDETEAEPRQKEIGKFFCYRVIIYVKIVTCLKLLIALLFLLFSGIKTSIFVASFLLTLWILAQSIAAAKAYSERSLKQATRAVRMMKIFCVALVCGIFYFLKQRISAKKGGHHHNSYDHRHGGHGSHDAELKFYTLCMIGCIVGLFIHVFFVLLNAKKVRKFLQEKEEEQKSLLHTETQA